MTVSQSVGGVTKMKADLKILRGRRSSVFLDKVPPLNCSNFRNYNFVMANNGEHEPAQARSKVYKRQSSSPFLKKPLPPPVIHRDEGAPSTSSQYSSIEGDDAPLGGKNENAIERHLTLVDLVAIGLGGTIGSGLFVLCGLVSHEYAGPATAISWAIAGFAACLSGCCYAEVSARIPLAGSAYSYSYVSMGELPAVLAAACLSLEYTAAAAAVARSWGDKCVLWITEEFGDHHWIHNYLNSDGIFSPLAFLISSVTVILLLNGIKESKQVTNFFTALKCALVLFMVTVAFYYTQPSNWTPFLPVQFGVAGVFRGATGTFFGYLGFDQVCGMGSEVINPKRDLPLSIMITLVGVTALYILATFALTGMQPWQEISSTSGFPAAFYALDAGIVGQITALGEIITLPIVVLITIMAQPRLQYAMSVDGLLPPLFQELDQHGNLWNSTAVAGVLMILTATLVPFEHLNDMVSCAVLCAMSMADSSLILLWHEPVSDPDSHLAERLMLSFHIASIVTSFAFTRLLDSQFGTAVAFTAGGCTIALVLGLYFWCPKSDIFGGRSSRHHYHKDQIRTDDGYFRTPFLPFLPCLGIFVNWYLIAQLEFIGLVGLICFLGLAVIYYFAYAVHHSVGNTTGWGHGEEEDTSSVSDESTKLVRTLSLTEMQ
jgi:APA family basic amino acid/polyamine antiporter